VNFSELAAAFANNVNQIISPRSLIPSALRPSTKGSVLVTGTGPTATWSAAPTADGSVLTSDATQTGGVGWIKAGRAYIYRTAAQAISDASWTDIDMDATLYDSTGSMVSLASNTITVPRTGYYLVQCCLHWASTGTSLVNGCRVLTGSGGTVIETMKEKASIGLSATSVEGSRTLNIASGTTLKLQGYWDFSGAGSHNTVGGEAFTFLSVNYLGE
jgi:hypothetical protein